MEVTSEELEANFRQLSDEELLERVAAGTLTELAMEVAARELKSRGLEMPEEATAFDPDATEVFPAEVFPGGEGGALVTVARFSNPLKANVLRACLESHGLDVFLWGEHLGTVHVIWSVAGGGMRVQVPSSQVVRAQELIAAWERGELAVDEEPE